MATIELCDLCNGKAKRELASINLRGTIPAFKGPIPPPPPGFKYNAEDVKNSSGKITYEKVWDHFGSVLKETRYIQPPKKFKGIEVKYDLCELCFEKFLFMLESIKKKYHLEATEMKLIEDNNNFWRNPFLGLIGPDEDYDDD